MIRSFFIICACLLLTNSSHASDSSSSSSSFSSMGEANDALYEMPLSHYENIDIGFEHEEKAKDKDIFVNQIDTQREVDDLIRAYADLLSAMVAISISGGVASAITGLALDLSLTQRISLISAGAFLILGSSAACYVQRYRRSSMYVPNTCPLGAMGSINLR